MYSVTGKLLFYAPKRHLVAKNEFTFSFRPTRKDQQVGGNMLMFHVDFNMKQFGICLKTTHFNDSDSTLSFERQLYTRCTFRFKILQNVFIHCYTLHER